MNDTKRIRVIIVDDSQFVREILSVSLAQDPMIEVVAVAVDAFQARDLIKQHNPDVITLDVEMPGMDGISFLEKIMRLRPMPVVMVSTLTAKGAEITLRALEVGAVDYVTKPTTGKTEDWEQTIELLRGKLRMAAKARVRCYRKTPDEMVTPIEVNNKTLCEMIAIGSSTGGVEALSDIITSLPQSMPPIVITQHMPALFTKSLAKRLDDKSALKVMEAQHQQKIVSGHVYIAPGDQHLRVHKQAGSDQFWCKLDRQEPISGHRPSVDVLFESVAAQVGKRTVGVILTGMGKDGAQGLLQMREKGAHTIGQNKESCVVYGMPAAAKKLGAVEKEVPLAKIPHAIVAACEVTK